MPAAIRATVAAPDKETFGHYPVTFFHIKIFSLFEAITETHAVVEKMVENSHSLNFSQN